MLRKILFILFLLYNTITYSQIEYNYNVINKKQQDSILMNEINNFIKKVYNSKYMIFVIHGYKSDTIKNSFLFSMSYILNDYDYERVNPEYYFELDNKIILVYISNNFNISNFNVFNPQMINESFKKKVINTLSSSERASATYEPPALLYCQKERKVKCTFYKHVEEIPLEISPYSKDKWIPLNYKDYIKKVDY